MSAVLGCAWALEPGSALLELWFPGLQRALSLGNRSTCLACTRRLEVVLASKIKGLGREAGRLPS